MNGILIVNKKKSVTSRDVVNDIVHIFNTKKVGHTGTLDPIASGVLVITLGKYTKLNEILTSEYKEYIAEFKIGLSTDTLDITGNILKEENISIEDNKIIDAINSFKCSYNQEVPIYSAVKVNGKKLYEYARNNMEVKLPKKNVIVKEIEVISIQNNIVKFKCLVSKGTYIRSLIRDIGNSLNIPTCMISLIRTKQGKFNIESSSTIEEIKKNNYKLLSIEEALDIKSYEVDNVLYKKVSNGAKIELNEYQDKYILFKKENIEICIYQRCEDYYRMYIKLED